MKTYHDCIPCFVRQSLEASRLVTGDKSLHERVLRDMLKKISEMDLDQPPPLMGREIHRKIRELTGSDDPYSVVKAEYNAFALGMYDEMKNRVKKSKDPFATAMRLAVAGNIIDFGVASDLDKSYVRRVIEDSLTGPLHGDPDHLEQAARKARHILYLGDNAGEILFDRILIEELPADRVVFAVRGGPVINDATMEDADAVGLSELVEVIDNGTDLPGTFLPECSDTFLRQFEKADLVISKGQGNYETLSGSGAEDKVVFLFKVKCEVVASDTHCEKGTAVALPGNVAGGKE